ncbi:hypothetical protein [Parafrankia sp. EUN1f]|uniref:hypothetical protein n=1 Tax=Parafrankia sp. EUN1f TaxID=102897 RepID=UPI0001C46D21|nr:hypothetical protein [Parafrankia sp. EUN1f]EFC80079.1 hypothetical protein FrEUN1fDRAFT_6806 [Parafrankia sp. EUN1f]
MTREDCEPLGAALVARRSGKNVIDIGAVAQYPPAYVRLPLVDIGDADSYPYGTDLEAGVMARYRSGGYVQIVLPDPDGDKVGAVLKFFDFRGMEELGRELLRIAAKRGEMHDPDLVRAQLPCKTCGGYGSIADGPEDGQACPDCTPELPADVPVTGESPF